MVRNKMQRDTKIEAKVIFASGNDYMGNKPLNYDHLVYKNRKELVLEVSDPILLDKLVKLAKTQGTYFPQIKELVKFLEKEEITYYIAKNTTEV